VGIKHIEQRQNQEKKEIRPESASAADLDPSAVSAADEAQVEDWQVSVDAWIEER